MFLLSNHQSSIINNQFANPLPASLSGGIIVRVVNADFGSAYGR
jgi:hypothetical protein